MCVTLTGLSRPVGVSLRLLLSKVVRLYEALKARARPFGVGTGFGSARGSVGSSRLYFISYLLPVAVPCGVRIRKTFNVLCGGRVQEAQYKSQHRDYRFSIL